VFSRSRLRAESPCRARGRRSPSNELLLAGTKLSGRARVAVAITAFTGLRKSEVRGLQWPDYTGDFLHVRRGVWRTTVGDTKTKESKNAVPVIGPLRRILDEHRRTTANGNGWILAGEKKGFALNLDNLRRREIQPVIREKWHGWQGFRRALSTNLYELGVPAEVSQIILRYASAETTREHYLKLQWRGLGSAAMRKLERELSTNKYHSKKAKPRRSRINTS
jgi:integrase